MFKQAIIVRTDIKMGKGKTAAQVAHASIDAYLDTARKQPAWASGWLAEGQKKVVLKVDSEKALFLLFEGIKHTIPSKLITDAGRTQLEEGTRTCLGVGPAPEPEIDKFIKGLKLL